MDLERELTRSRDVDWPATPELRLVLEPRRPQPASLVAAVASRRSSRSPPRSPCRSRAARSSASSTSAARRSSSSTRCRPPRTPAARRAGSARAISATARGRPDPGAAPPAGRPAGSDCTGRRGRLGRLRPTQGTPVLLSEFPSGERLPQEARRRSVDRRLGRAARGTSGALALRRRPRLLLPPSRRRGWPATPRLGGTRAPPTASKGRWSHEARDASLDPRPSLAGDTP